MESDFNASRDESDFGKNASSKTSWASASNDIPGAFSSSPESVTVVGGAGRMGRLFVRLFQEAGYETRVADISDGPIDWAEVTNCDLIVITAPMDSVDKIAKELGPFTGPETAIIDMSSLQSDSMNILRKDCNGTIIGCHPLFGPAKESIGGGLFFLCVSQTTPWSHWFKSFLEKRSAVVVEKSAREHDELMAVAQSLRHMMLIAFGLTLKRLDFAIEQDLDHSGEWFGKLMELLRKQMEQPARLYADIALMNRAFPHVFQTFSQEVWDLFHKITAQDRDGLIDSINDLSGYVMDRG